ncbi:PLDc N-terminal domain-containing protein [Streptosporangium sp. NBC_01755]|nr:MULTISPECIES: PLDc N-terminal domain-containing protein [unclassified Streptosporangium]WSA24830.1 PLDc N-terminal domain-containing protein [Streptosporangium sp. NBC_01810]WSD03987.1 PLDc N-terminal domain-containing protein [Streptosporangium sp. NBC_01755]
MAYSSGMPLLVGLAILAFWLYCLFDAITTPDEESRNLPKLLWVLIVVLLPTIGGLFWLLLGRPNGPRAPRSLLAEDTPPRPEAPKGPDDDPDFLKDLDRRLRDED